MTQLYQHYLIRSGSKRSGVIEVVRNGDEPDGAGCRGTAFAQAQDETPNQERRRHRRHRYSRIAAAQSRCRSATPPVSSTPSRPRISASSPIPTWQHRCSAWRASRSSAAVRVANRRASPSVRLRRRLQYDAVRWPQDFHRRQVTARVDFSTVGSDFIGGLSVYKTPDVSLSSSSIGATVNVQFAKPFDHPGFGSPHPLRLVAGQEWRNSAVGRPSGQRHLCRRYDRHPRRRDVYPPRHPE